MSQSNQALWFDAVPLLVVGAAYLGASALHGQRLLGRRGPAPGDRSPVALSLLSAYPVVALAATVELVVDTTQTIGEIDLTRYALGQGGLSEKPMIDAHIDQLARLQPRTIRLFVQEYFDLYPEPGRYHWDTLDHSIEAILATGARPLLCLCFKPRVLFPKIEQDVVHPTSYKEWEKLVFELVKHCNQRRRYGVEYWEVGNEPDIGKDGGCPYRFKPEDYVAYYTRTANAILRADPKARVGGPALAGYRSRLGDALIQHCAQGARSITLLYIFCAKPRDEPPLKQAPRAAGSAATNGL